MNKRGRPAQNKEAMIHVQVHTDVKEALEKLCIDMGITQSDLLAGLIRKESIEYYQRERKEYERLKKKFEPNEQ